MSLIEQAAQALYDARTAHQADDTQPSAENLLAVIWSRYLDRVGRPDPYRPCTQEERARRARVLAEVYRVAHLNSESLDAVVSDVITDLLHLAAFEEVIGESDDVPAAGDLTATGLSNFRIETAGR
ncbi:hypothetical protein [Streptomyces sp. NBC_01579]|uniref:hypothetical protein n=1 Tax=Streptomyces sp. NBC_01579 TaxID=2975885 RepID=UPI003869CC31